MPFSGPPPAAPAVSLLPGAQPRAASREKHAPQRAPTSGSVVRAQRGSWVMPRRVALPERMIRLEHSLVVQMDGLLHAILGRRIERDVCAASLSASHCELFGRSDSESCSTFDGLFLDDFTRMPSWIQLAEQHRARGVFVVPVHPGAGPLITATCYSKKKKAPQPSPWFDFLLKHAELTFPLPRDALLDEAGLPLPPGGAGLLAVVASFGHIGRSRGKRRPERSVDLFCIPAISTPPFRLKAVPVLLTRVSPLADALRPSPSADRLPDAGPVPGPITSSPPTQMKSRWDAREFRALASDYPHPEVAELAIQAAGLGVDPFVGNIEKMVAGSPGLAPPEVMEKARERLVEEASVGRVWGPSVLPPFRSFRPCRIFPVPKDKHDPTSERFRICSHFSEGGDASVNGLCYSPHILAFHSSAAFLRDEIASAGPGCKAWVADIPDCFRGQAILARLLPLFVYIILTEEFGQEFFVDLANPFGWSPSEWGWQLILAIFMWTLLKWGLASMLAYVDNFFLIVPKSLCFETLSSLADESFAKLGIPLHEQSRGSSFKGLGWLWDLSTMTMSCPEDKFVILLGYLESWRAMDSMSLMVLEKAVGLMNWVVAGFPQGKASLSHFIHLRTKAKSIQKRTGASPAAVVVTVSDEAKRAVAFWFDVFSSWDRQCPIVISFGPTASFQILGRVDASTAWGCGGFCFDGEVLRGFTHAWTPDERALAFVTERESTGVFELLGVLWWFRSFADLCGGLRVQLELDSSPAVLGLQAGYSARPDAVEQIELIMSICVQHHILLRVRHIVGSIFNIIADRLSHNDVDTAQCQALTEFGMRLCLAVSPGTRL